MAGYTLEAVGWFADRRLATTTSDGDVSLSLVLCSGGRSIDGYSRLYMKLYSPQGQQYYKAVYNNNKKRRKKKQRLTVLQYK